MSRDFSEQRCMICGGFMLPDENGELCCPECNCYVSEVDYFLPEECR